MRTILTKVLISLFCVTLIFGVGSSNFANPVSAHETNLGVNKWSNVGWTKYGYKYNLYLSHSTTHKIIANYRALDVIITAANIRIPTVISKIILTPLASAFRFEGPIIQKADKGKGIYIPITITWSGLPWLHGYYPQ